MGRYTYRRLPAAQISHIVRGQAPRPPGASRGACDTSSINCFIVTFQSPGRRGGGRRSPAIRFLATTSDASLLRFLFPEKYEIFGSNEIFSHGADIVGSAGHCARSLLGAHYRKYEINMNGDGGEQGSRTWQSGPGTKGAGTEKIGGNLDEDRRSALIG